MLHKVKSAGGKKESEMEYGPFAYFDGKIIPIEEAKVSIMTHSFNYGTGVFEGIRGTWNKKDQELYIFKLREHYDRLLRNCNIIRVQPPLDLDEICDVTVKLCAKNGFKTDIYIRPLIYKSHYSVSPALHGTDELAIYVLPFGDYVNTQGLRCMTSSWRRVMDNAVPCRGKIIGAYANSALAVTEAHDAGYDEAIVLREDGTVSEGSAMNLFMVRDGTLITTPLTSDILEGITRESIIELAENELKMRVEVRPIGRTEMYICDELFFTGTGAKVAPVIEVDSRLIASGETGPMTRRIQKLYLDVMQRKVPKYRKWCVPVYRKRKSKVAAPKKRAAARTKRR